MRIVYIDSWWSVDGLIVVDATRHLSAIYSCFNQTILFLSLCYISILLSYCFLSLGFCIHAHLVFMYVEGFKIHLGDDYLCPWFFLLFLEINSFFLSLIFFNLPTIFFMSSKYFISVPRLSIYLQHFSRDFSELRNIFCDLNSIILDFLELLLTVKLNILKLENSNLSLA